MVNKNLKNKVFNNKFIEYDIFLPDFNENI